MRFTDLIKILLVVILFSFFTACSDNNNNPSSPDNGNNPPTLSVKQIPIPQAMQTAANNGDPGAAQAVAYITIANTLPAYAQFFNPPANAGKISSTTATLGSWTWTQNGTTFTLVSSETDNGYEMTLTVNGSFNGKTYSNAILFDVTMPLDQNSGELYFNDPNTGNPILGFIWENLSDQSYHLTINDTEGSTTSEFYSYPNGSGTLNINNQGVNSWEIDWGSDGSGTWTQYDPENNPIDSGSWG